MPDLSDRDVERIAKAVQAERQRQGSEGFMFLLWAMGCIVAVGVLVMIAEEMGWLR